MNTGLLNLLLVGASGGFIDNSRNTVAVLLRTVVVIKLRLYFNRDFTPGRDDKKVIGTEGCTDVFYAVAHRAQVKSPGGFERTGISADTAWSN